MAKRLAHDADTQAGNLAKSTKTRAKRNTSTKPQPWTFPKNRLEDTIRLAQAIEEKNAGKPVPAGDLCKMVGFTNPSDWRFLDLLKSANQYQLVEGSGATATVSLNAIGADIVAPSIPSQRQEALLNAFLAVDQFKQVYEFYAGKKIPEDEFFANKLVRDFSVPRERVQAFIDVLWQTSVSCEHSARTPKVNLLLLHQAQ
jgi:hypothetical protein